MKGGAIPAQRIIRILFSRNKPERIQTVKKRDTRVLNQKKKEELFLHEVLIPNFTEKTDRGTLCSCH